MSVSASSRLAVFQSLPCSNVVIKRLFMWSSFAMGLRE